MRSNVGKGDAAPAGTMLLTRDDLSRLLTVQDYLDVVQEAFLAHAEGRTLKPGLLHVNADGGEFHIKVGGLTMDRPYFALKANGGFFGNVARFDMPPIQGIIMLADAECGYPLALMDSTGITLGRTGATTALAALHLARPDSSVVTICGCGSQGRVQLRYITHVCPIATAFVWDIDAKRAEQFAACMSEQLGIDVRAVADLQVATQQSDICITCTPARQPYLRPEHIPPGMFIAAIGADSPQKQELDPRIFASAKVVVDLVEQCAAVGELHHALEAGAFSLNDVHAELADVLVGRKVGRTSRDEVTVFDATGTALQDAAAAAAAFKKAMTGNYGAVFDFYYTAENGID